MEPNRWAPRRIIAALLGAAATLLGACVPPPEGPAGTPAPAAHLLLPGAQLAAGDALVSTTGHRLTVQADGNIVLHHHTASGPRVAWTLRTDGKVDVRLTMQADGNLVATDGSRRVLWWNARAEAGSYLELSADGNLAQYQPVTGGRVKVWETATGSDRNGHGCPAGANRPLCERSASAARTNSAARAIKAAFAKLGTPYGSTGRFGPHAYDCSGLMWAAYRDAGIDIGANLSATIITPGGPRVGVPLGEARPGDIVWYQGHVAMALADGKVIEAARPGTSVRVANFAHRGFQRAVRINAA